MNAPSVNVTRGVNTLVLLQRAPEIPSSAAGGREGIREESGAAKPIIARLVAVAITFFPDDND